MTTSKVAVVTGATRGIGRACAVALAEAGWTVAIGYRSDEAAAKEALGALESAGTPGLTVFLDTTDRGLGPRGVPPRGRRGRQRHRAS